MNSEIALKTINGKNIDGVKWKIINGSNLGLNHTLVISHIVEDIRIVNWISKGIDGCIAYKHEETNYELLLSMKITSITHLLDTSGEIESIYTVVPQNSNIDDLVVYLFDNQNQQFNKMLNKYI